jgi:hypothetical protein
MPWQAGARVCGGLVQGDEQLGDGLHAASAASADAKHVEWNSSSERSILLMRYAENADD